MFDKKQSVLEWCVVCTDLCDYRGLFPRVVVYNMVFRNFADGADVISCNGAI